MLADPTSLPEPSIVGFAALALVYFAAFAVKGVIGLGSLTPTVLFGTFIVGPHDAVLLALLVNLCAQIQFLPQALRDGDWGLGRRMIVANFVGAGVGVWLFGWLDPTLLTITLGAALGAVCLADMTDALRHLTKGFDLARPLPLAVLSGIAGLVSGVTGAGGLLLLALYLRLATTDPRSFRGTVLLMASIIVAWRFVLLLGAGHITVPLVVRATALLPFALAGGVFGTIAFPRMAPRRFYLVFQMVLLFAAGVLLVRGAAALQGDVG